jgi:lysophospholipase L1-like esterase
VSPAYEREPEGDELLELLEQNPPTFFKRNLRSMLALASEYDVDVLLATFAHSSLSPWLDKGIAEHNDVIRLLAQEHDVLFFDFEAAMPSGEALWDADGIHVTEEGAKRKAELFAEFLAKSWLPASDALSIDRPKREVEGLGSGG